MLRKRRTRQHVIADLAVHHIEGFVLRQGWTIERFWHDYGYDLSLFTYNDSGEIEEEFIFCQVKSSDTLEYSADGTHARMTLEVRDLMTWMRELLPVVLLVFDAQRETMYWFYVQRDFTEAATLSGHIYVTANLPVKNRVDADALRQFRAFKETILQQVPGGNPPWLRR